MPPPTPAEVLRLLATKAPPSVATKAARALGDPSPSQRTLNELVAEVLGMETPSPFSPEERGQLIAAIVPSADGGTDYDRGPFDATLPRVRCRQDQADAFAKSMAAAGFSDVAKYIRWRLFG